VASSDKRRRKWSLPILKLLSQHLPANHRTAAVPANIRNEFFRLCFRCGGFHWQEHGYPPCVQWHSFKKHPV